MDVTSLVRHLLKVLFVFEISDINAENIPSGHRLLWTFLRTNSITASRITNEKGPPFNFSSYQRLDNIHRYLDYLAETYPQTASVGVMGYTAEERPLKYINISSGISNAKVVFIDGGIHAREWISVSSVTYITNQLVENRMNLPQELLTLDFYIIPVLNPDGYEYSHTTDRMWRKNRSGSGECRGVDINRNFDIYFGHEGSSDDSCSETYQGAMPHSELESKALSEFLLNLKGRLKAYITFHSYGQHIMIPYNYDYDVKAPNFDEMKSLGDKASEAMGKIDDENYYVGSSTDILLPAAGGSDDWVKASLGVKYVYCIELRDTGHYAFLLPAEQIIPTGREAFEAVKVIGAAASEA